MDQVLKQSLYLAEVYENASIHMGTTHEALSLGVNAATLPS